MTPVLILDGGLGTTLERNHGYVFSSIQTPLWSSDLLITDPKTLQDCQQTFADAGAHIIETATYQVSIQGFSDSKSGEFPNGVSKRDIAQFLDRAISIASTAAARSSSSSSSSSSSRSNGKVALSLGPYGACMIPSQEYTGEYGDLSETELREWHRERLRLFLEEDNLNNSTKSNHLADRVDYIALETIPKISEIKIMRNVLSEIPELGSIPYWISCLYPNDAQCLPYNSEHAEAALRAMLDPEHGRMPWGVGINCTKVHRVKQLVQTYAKCIEHFVTEKVIEEWPALILYPDGTNGEVYNTITQKWEGPESANVQGLESWETQMGDIVKAEQARGTWRAIVVGGCCCADPRSISHLSRLLFG